MNVKCIKVGLYQCNCYILEKEGKLLVIDPGDEYEKIKKELDNPSIEAILITHFHPDHIGALDYFDCNIYSYKNLKEEKIKIGPFKFEVIYTKGHTSDSVTYYFYQDNLLFTGDFLFKNTIGRCDLPTGNINQMKDSLNKIKKYPDNLVIYPGHGDKSTLGIEKKENEYLKNI